MAKVQFLVPNPRYNKAKDGPGSPSMYMNPRVDAEVDSLLEQFTAVELCGIMYGLADELGFTVGRTPGQVRDIFDMIEEKAEARQETADGGSSKSRQQQGERDE